MCTIGEEIAMKHEKIGETRGEARGRAEMLVQSIDTLLKRHNSLAEACESIGTTVKAYTDAKTILSLR